ncbi:hypothetical protein TNCV_3243241 [Trichonephila clavipes]|nr:hypothetical protein TNCV_3243241 [Trichonephila clavipes]
MASGSSLPQFNLSVQGGTPQAENADMHSIYGQVNGNVRAALPMYHAQFPDRRMPDRRIVQRLNHQLRETRSSYVTRSGAGRDEDLYAVQAWKKPSLTLWLIDQSQVKEMLLITKPVLHLQAPSSKPILFESSKIYD